MQEDDFFIKINGTVLDLITVLAFSMEIMSVSQSQHWLSTIVLIYHMTVSSRCVAGLRANWMHMTEAGHVHPGSYYPAAFT